jgi:hypothetical protein
MLNARSKLFSKQRKATAIWSFIDPAGSSSFHSRQPPLRKGDLIHHRCEIRTVGPPPMKLIQVSLHLISLAKE